MPTRTQIAGQKPKAKASTSSRTTDANRLIRAIEQNNARDFKALLKNGADVNAKDKGKNNVLYHAVYWNRTGMAKELIKRGAHLPDDILAGAVFHGNLELVKLLIAKGANVDCIFRKRFAWEKFPNGSTLLGFAVQRVGFLGYPRKIIELLIAGGANVNKPSPWFVPWANNDKEGIKCRHASPLQIAAIRGMEDVMSLLWKAGATGTLKEVMNECRLDLAAHRGVLPVVKLAIKAGIDVNAPGYQRKRPIEFAREAGHMEIVRLLKRAGATD